MDAIKNITVIFFLIPIFLNSQEKKESLYPKDTVYLKYEIIENVAGNNIKSKELYQLGSKEGIKFWWQGKWLFHPSSSSIDVLRECKINEIQFLSLEELKKKHFEWNQELFQGKPKPPGYLNDAFVIYLVESSGEKQAKIYRVFFLNEGVIP